MVFTLGHIRLNIYVWKTKFSSHKLFGVLFSMNIKSPIQSKAHYNFFYSVWKETSHKPLKVAAAKKSFQVFFPFYWYNLPEWMFFIGCYNSKTFWYKFIVIQWFGTTAMLLCFLKLVFWNKPVFCIRYLHNNIAILVIPKQRSKIKLLLLLRFQQNSLFQCVNFLYFSL